MIIKFIIIVVTVEILLIALHLCEYIKRKNSTISFKETLDLTDLPIITFNNNDIKINMLLDTGSSISLIDSSIIDKLIYTKIEGITTMFGVGGEGSPGENCIMEISHKKEVYKNIFVISDLSGPFNTIKSESGVNLHGILGNDFFEKYKYVLDFKDYTAYVR